MTSMEKRDYTKDVLSSIGYYQDELHKAETILGESKMPGIELSHKELILSMRLAQTKISNVLTDLATLEDTTKDQLS
ncbi:unnamed protein product [Fructobacillus fructosus]|uniref:Uncharacterized protein n=2 Tax=Fructobacillus fructosus TaxID=1631 RepID=A0ABM9MRC8_9LACO|nr:unnamed protein product [Fructobacillus fructosus]